MSLVWLLKKQLNNWRSMKYVKHIFSLASISALIISACGPHHQSFKRCDPKFYFVDQTNYDVNPKFYTPRNIAVDTSGLDINLNMIDRLTNETEQCLMDTFGNPPTLSPKVASNGWCQSFTFDLPVHRECLVVKVASDWFLSTYDYNGSKQQQLPYSNGGSCTDKGLPPGKCYYRVGIQDNTTIAVPPSFYLYKDGLVRIITGCKNPWYSDPLANCMNPTTQPLDNGMQP